MGDGGGAAAQVGPRRDPAYDGLAGRRWGEVMFERMIDRLARGLELALGVALLVAVALNFVNVVGRYGLGATFLGADEVEIYILVWIAFLGAALAAWRRQHLRMDVIVRLLPLRVQHWLRVAELLVLASVAGFVAFHSYRYVAKIHSLGAVSDIAEVPTWIPHAAILLGFVSIAAIALFRLGRALGSARSKEPGV